MNAKEYDEAASRAFELSIKAYDTSTVITGKDRDTEIIREFICIHIQYAIEMLREILISAGAIEETQED